MKKVFLLLLFLLLPVNVFAENEINIYYFHADGCHNCEIMTECLNNLKQKYILNIKDYEVRNNSENYELMDKVKEGLSDKNLSGVPFIALGDKYVHGGSDAKCERLEDIIKEYQTEDYIDTITLIVNGTYVRDDGPNEESVPVDTSKLTEDDVYYHLFRDPKIMLSIVIVILLVIYFFITNKKGNIEDEKKK